MSRGVLEGLAQQGSPVTGLLCRSQESRGIITTGLKVGEVGGGEGGVVLLSGEGVHVGMQLVHGRGLL